MLGDENGQVSPHFIEFAETSEPAWLDPEQPLSMAFGPTADSPPGGAGISSMTPALTPTGFPSHFIPNGDSAERFQSFSPPCTTIPCFDTQYDPADRAFTRGLSTPVWPAAGSVRRIWTGPGRAHTTVSTPTPSRRAAWPGTATSSGR